MELKTTKIKGKDYVEVNTRIKYFRESGHYKDWSLATEIVELNESWCVLKALVKDASGEIKATGLAYEKADSSHINRTSYIENCETSAWGRALGNLGIGIDKSIASKEEVETAISQQKEPLTLKKTPKKATKPASPVYDHENIEHKILLHKTLMDCGITDREEQITIAKAAIRRKIRLDKLNTFVFGEA